MKWKRVHGIQLNGEIKLHNNEIIWKGEKKKNPCTTQHECLNPRSLERIWKYNIWRAMWCVYPFLLCFSSMNMNFSLNKLVILMAYSWAFLILNKTLKAITETMKLTSSEDIRTLTKCKIPICLRSYFEEFV